MAVISKRKMNEVMGQSYHKWSDLKRISWLCPDGWYQAAGLGVFTGVSPFVFFWSLVALLILIRWIDFFCCFDLTQHNPAATGWD